MKTVFFIFLPMVLWVSSSLAGGQAGSLARADSSTVVLWHLDEGSGGVFHDASLYANDGGVYNASWVAGMFGGGLWFNGQTSYGIAPNSASMRPQSELTVEAWFAIDTLEFPLSVPFGPPIPTLLSNLGPYPHGGGYQIHFTVAPLQVHFHYRTPTWSVTTPGIPITEAHHFYHIAAVYRAVDSGASVRVYLDDVLRDSAEFSEQIQYDNTNNFYVGTNIDGVSVGSIGPREFPGIIDEIRISNVALEPDQFGAKELSISKRSLDFGLLEVGKSTSLDVSISNLAFYESIHVDSITTSNPDFATDQSGFDLAPVTSHTLSVMYTPTAAEKDTGTLTIWALGAGLPAKTVSLGGRGFELTDAPIINKIADVLEDQGKQVRVTWYPSTFDAPGESLTVTQYSLWRRVEGSPGAAAGEVPLSVAVSGGTSTSVLVNGELWDFIVVVPAVHFEQYAFVAPTLKNATPFGLNWSVFRVAAHTASGEFFFSAPDSGYSYDNVYPLPPPGLQASLLSGRVRLSWEASGAEDVREYRVYRSTSPNIVPSAYSRIASATALEYIDSTIVADSAYYYLLTSVDSSWNESAPTSAVGAVSVVGVDENGRDLPREFALEQNYPNPFNPSTKITYDLPQMSHVRLTVLNLLGQEVVVIVQGVQNAGEYHYTWSPDLGSGIYFYRFEATSASDASVRFTSVRKMLFVK